MKDIIYPTIKNQFDKLTMNKKFHPLFKAEYIEFQDTEGKSRITYVIENNRLVYHPNYFMMNYFGYRDKDDKIKETVDEILRELLQKSLPIDKGTQIMANNLL